MVEVAERLGASQDAGCGTNLEVDLVPETSLIQLLVLQNPVAVADPLCLEHIQGLLDALGGPHLPSMHSPVDPERCSLSEHLHCHRVKHVRVSGVQTLLVPCDVHAHHPDVPM